MQCIDSNSILPEFRPKCRMNWPNRVCNAPCKPRYTVQGYNGFHVYCDGCLAWFSKNTEAQPTMQQLYERYNPLCPMCVYENVDKPMHCKRHVNKNKQLMEVIHPACPNHKDHPLLKNEPLEAR